MVENNKMKNVDYKFLIIIFLLALICYIQFIQTRNLKRFFYFLYGVNVVNQIDYDSMLYGEEKLNREFQNYGRFHSNCNGMRNCNMKNAHNVYSNDDFTDKDNDRNTLRWGRKHYFNRNNQNNMNNSNLDLQTNYDKMRNLFTVKMNLLNNFEQKDLKVNLKDNFLIISVIETNEINNNQHLKNHNVIRFSKMFKLPATKATINDVKQEIKDNKLIVMVPIIE